MYWFPISAGNEIGFDKKIIAKHFYSSNVQTYFGKLRMWDWKRVIKTGGKNLMFLTLFVFYFLILSTMNVNKIDRIGRNTLLPHIHTNIHPLMWYRFFRTIYDEFCTRSNSRAQFWLLIYASKYTVRVHGCGDTKKNIQIIVENGFWRKVNTQNTCSHIHYSSSSM